MAVLNLLYNEKIVHLTWNSFSLICLPGIPGGTATIWPQFLLSHMCSFTYLNKNDSYIQTRFLFIFRQHLKNQQALKTTAFL